MNPELIIMLTHNDVTVPNAREMFGALKILPVQHWGFKDVGLPADEMRDLVAEMGNAGKTTYLEVVSLSESEGLAGARLAVAAGFDVLMGTVYFDSIRQYLAKTPVKYFPFLGQVYGHPSILTGTLDEIVAHARFLEAEGVDGFDLLTYRYTGDAPQLLTAVVQATSLPIVSAGSIDSFERIAQVKRAGAWAFTVGTAFFEARFVPGGSFQANSLAVWDALHGPEAGAEA
jgi:hypothetical protein